MRAINRLGILGLAAGALAGCALQARTDIDPRASVATCHTYAFREGGPNHGEAGAFANPLNDKRLREAIRANLAVHGIQPAAEGTAADCVVGYSIGSRLAADPGYPRFGWGLGLGWGRRNLGATAAWDSGPYDYREGRVTVNLFDAHSHDPLWHAYVDEDVTGLMGDTAQQHIDAAVAAIFAKFPAGANPPAVARP